jgi:hypothetical protein
MVTEVLTEFDFTSGHQVSRLNSRDLSKEWGKKKGLKCLFLRPFVKPYFARLLKSEKVEINISAEFEDELLVVQTARSEALERINQEIIDSVKFRFLERDIVNRQYQDGDAELINIRTLQEGLDASLLYSLLPARNNTILYWKLWTQRKQPMSGILPGTHRSFL